MITVSPLSEKAEIEEFFKKTNLNTDENSGCVVAKSNGEILGFCLYKLTNEGITVIYIEPKDDLPLADGILRSVLHIAASRNVMDARYEGTDNEEIFSKLGFILDKSRKKLDIDKLFRGCGCHN